MQSYDIYQDIASRTGGDIYIGVVGPVRTGKSTFITKFMQEMVLPNMTAKKKVIAVDEMPQSASGKTIMTTEPKFVPAEAVNVKVGKKSAKVRLIDCVGYVVKGALGADENGTPRKVKTPWQDEEMDFNRAAEYGTQKVIKEHSTIGVVVTGDGSFTEIERIDYESAEDRVINELKSLNKPFIVLFNTTKPEDEAVKRMAKSIEKKHDVTVVIKDVSKLDKAGVEEILTKVLEQFPMRVFDIDIPKWLTLLDNDSPIIKGLFEAVDNATKNVTCMKSCHALEKIFDDSEYFLPVEDFDVDMATGRVYLKAKVKSGVFFDCLSNYCGEQIADEASLLECMRDFAQSKRSYNKLKTALECAETTGYGVVCADLSESTVSEPEVVKKQGGYCVRLKADAKSLHIIRAEVSAQVDPVCGTKEQCEDFVSLVEEEGLNAKVFGRSLCDIVDDKLQTKSQGLSEGVKGKLKRVVSRAVNENKNGLICILM